MTMASTRFVARKCWRNVLCALGVSAALTSAVSAQQGQWVFGTPDDEYLPERISSLPGGGSISCGNMVTTLHDASTSVVWMLKFDNFYPQVAIPTMDGKLAVAGTYISGNANQLLLVKLDMSGMVDWMHVYPAYNLQRSCDLIELPDMDGDNQGDGFMLAAEILNDQGSRLPLLIRTKPSGSPVWMHRYDAPNFSAPLGEFSFVEMAQENADELPVFNLTGELGEFPGNRDTLLTRVDYDGNVILSRVVGFTDHYDFGRGLTRALESGFLVTGYSKQAGEGGGTYLMHVNNDFTLDWYRSIYGFHGTKEIVQDTSFDAHIVGGLGYPYPVSNMTMLAINTMSQNLSWGMQYGGTDGDGASDFARTSTGYDIYGSTRSYDLMAPRDFYLVKTDFSGVSGCNEESISLDLVANQPASVPVELIAVPVDEVVQKYPQGWFVEYKERDICPEPDPCACVDPPDQMVGWWTFDETTGSIAADSIASNDGNHIGNATPAPGMVEYGILLDGAGDYVEVAPSPALEVPAADPLTGLGNFSIDAWIRVDSMNSMTLGPIVDKRDWGGGPGYAFYVRDSRLHIELRDLVTGSYEYASSQVLPMGSFVHVGVAVQRYPTFSVGFHVNGVLDLAAAPVAITGSLANPDAALWIGGTRYYPNPGTAEQFFEGIIDEVEIFDRALDTSEFAALYNAQECGKCKFDCHVPWDMPFCINDTSIIVDVTIYNYSPVDSQIDLSFAPVNPPSCGSINGPTGFTVVSPSNPVLVPGNSSVVAQVSIDRPIDMTFFGAVGCYEVTLTNLANGNTNTCMGSVQDRRDLCPQNPTGGVVALVPGRESGLSIQVVNTGLKEETFQWSAVVYGPDMEVLSNNVSINGNPAGQGASGQVQVPIGGTVDIPLSLLAQNFEGNSRSDLVLFTQPDGNLAGGQLVPLTSIGIITTLEGDTPCPADLDGDGSVNGADLSRILGSWGECVGCATDLNGDGLVNGVDLTTLLGSWGLCP